MALIPSVGEMVVLDVMLLYDRLVQVSTVILPGRPVSPRLALRRVEVQLLRGEEVVYCYDVRPLSEYAYEYIHRCEL